jgi:hypothetical protein
MKMEIACGTCELKNFTSSITENIFPCAGGKKFLDPCTASYQKVTIIDISSLMLEISGSKPLKHQKLTSL